MLTDEEEQMLKTLEEMEAQKQPITHWQWATIEKLKAAKNPVRPKGMKLDNYKTFLRLMIKQDVHRVNLTEEEAAQYTTLRGVLRRSNEEQEKKEYEEYMMGPPIEPVAQMGMYMSSRRPPPQRW